MWDYHTSQTLYWQNGSLFKADSTKATLVSGNRVFTLIDTHNERSAITIRVRMTHPTSSGR